jgi:hypothetical protein
MTDVGLCVRTVFPYPRHGWEKKRRSEWDAYCDIVTQGRTFPSPKVEQQVIFLAAPIAPTSNWKCGTDVIWPVLKMKGSNIDFRGLLAVCRHQIEAGD